MKHGIITKKGIISAVVIVAVAGVLGGGSVSADKAHAEMIAQEKAIAAAQAEREARLAKAAFEPVVELKGYETLDIGDSMPVVYVKNDAADFNAQIQADIEAEEARLAAEAEAKAKAEQEVKEQAEREAREEQARQEAAQNNASTGNESTDAGAGDASAESTPESSGDASTEGSQEESTDGSAPSGGNDISVLYKYVGCQYKYGGTSPSSGWDCSGFVQYVMANEFGVSLNRTSGGQASNGYAISVSDSSQWQPGDLLIYRSGSGNIGHVAIYLGGGQMIHALNEKYDTFVQSVSVYEGWDSNTLVKVRRVLP